MRISKEIKDFTRKLVIFLVLLVLTDQLIGIGVRTYYFSQTDRCLYGMEKCREDILILGSSRANHHYIPSILSDSLQLSCYNLGRDAQCIYYHYALLKSVFSRYAPKIVILDLMEMDYNKAPSRELDKLSVLLPYADKEGVREVLALRKPTEKLKLLSGLYPFNSTLLTLFSRTFKDGKENGDFMYNGYLPIYGKVSKDLQADRNYRQAQPDSVKLGYIRKIIELCKQNNSSLFLIASPMYVRGESFDTWKSVEDLARRSNVECWNYEQDSLFLAHKEYFKDRNHLNDEGAKVYTKIVAGRIKHLYEKDGRD